jgi:hypothetical protein
MLDGKMEVHRETFACLLDGTFQSMANQMALAKAMHTGRRVSPDEFYRRPTSFGRATLPVVSHDGFATMKALFVK